MSAHLHSVVGLQILHQLVPRRCFVHDTPEENGKHKKSEKEMKGRERKNMDESSEKKGRQTDRDYFASLRLFVIGLC